MRYRLEDLEDDNNKPHQVMIREGDNRAIATAFVDPLVYILFDHPEVAEGLFLMLRGMRDVKDFREGIQA